MRPGRASSDLLDDGRKRSDDLLLLAFVGGRYRGGYWSALVQRDAWGEQDRQGQSLGGGASERQGRSDLGRMRTDRERAGRPRVGVVQRRRRR